MDRILYNGYGQRTQKTAPLFYVDPGGSDSGSGNVSLPFATMDYCRQYITGNGVNIAMVDDIYVQVNDGDYYDTHVAFTDADSGSKGYDIHYVGQTLAGAKLNGGTIVTGWSLYSGSVYRAAVAGPIVTTMWENGIRAEAARFPARVPDGSFPMSRAPYLQTEGVDGSQTVLQYKAADSLPNPALWNLNSVQVFDWSGANSLVTLGSRFWFANPIPVQSVNTGSRQLTLSQSELYSLFTTSIPSNYFVQGDLAFLVGAGQFYHDIVGGFLYYWPRSTPIGSQTIVIPSQTNVIAFNGSSTNALVHNIVLDGLQVRYSKFAHQSTALFKGSLVYLTNAMNIRVNRCNINETGGSGIGAQSWVQGLKVTATLVRDCGMYGIYLENYPTISPDIGDVMNGNLISNVRVHDTGELIGDGTGVAFVNSGHSTLEYFDIYNSPKQGVQILGYDVDDAKNYANNVTVRSGRIHAACQETGDTGSINLGQTAHRLNTIAGVWMDNINAASFMNDATPVGIFPDNNSDGAVISDCEVTNSTGTYRNNSGGTVTQVNCSWNAGFTTVNHAAANVLTTFPVFP